MDLGTTFERQKNLLGGVSREHFQQLERNYQYGVVGNGTLALELGEVRYNEPILNQEGEPVNTKLLCVHPGEIPLPEGHTGPVKYSGSGTYSGYRRRHIDDEAILRVTPDIKPEDISLEDIGSLLIGDREDQALENKGVRVRSHAV